MPTFITAAAAAHLVLIRAITEVAIGQVIAGSSIKARSFELAIIDISLALSSHKLWCAGAVEAIEKNLKII